MEPHLPKPQFSNTDEYNAYMRAHGTPIPPPPAYIKPTHASPPITTDVSQVLKMVAEHKPVDSFRCLRYYGSNGGIFVVSAAQVHSANVAGVVITENGPDVFHRTLIPWRRVEELIAHPDDPILNVKG